MKRHYFSLLAFLCFLSSNLLAAEEWELRKDRDGIQVYTRDVEGSPHKEVRATTVVENITLTSLVALLEDVEACSDWSSRCAESYLLERLSETDSIVYTHNNLPFPVKDRDIVAHVSWFQDPMTYEAVMTSTATLGRLEEKRGRLRLEYANVFWIFTPTTSGAIRVSNQAHIDPGSSLPGWVTNMLLVDTPYETLLEFITAVTNPEYQNAKLDFIQEPMDN